MRLTAPQPRTRDRSFPVPSGRTATGGKGLMARSSMTERTQPTVPSPPHARILMSLRSPNIFRLGQREGKREREGEGEREGGEQRDVHICRSPIKACISEVNTRKLALQKHHLTHLLTKRLVYCSSKELGYKKITLSLTLSRYFLFKK